MDPICRPAYFYENFVIVTDFLPQLRNYEKGEKNTGKKIFKKTSAENPIEIKNAKKL